jgi:hypothetical protein
MLYGVHPLSGAMSMDDWAAKEFGGAKLGDGRLTKRLIKVASAFAERPTASIPGACSGWVETQAAYRFFDQASEKKQGLGWEDILTPHLECTIARMRQHRVVLCLQDTTELDFNGQRIEGLGPLSFEAQRGMFCIPPMPSLSEREPLGMMDAWMWAREFKEADGSRPGILESIRWIEGYERVAEAAARMPGTRLVYIADREADILGMMQRAHALETPADWMVRSKHNRCLPDGGQAVVESPLEAKAWARSNSPCLRAVGKPLVSCASSSLPVASSCPTVKADGSHDLCDRPGNRRSPRRQAD